MLKVDIEKMKYNISGTDHDIVDNYYEFIEEQLTGEIADVYIILAQLLRIFNISDSQIKEKIIKKLERQADRNKKAEDLKNV